MSSFEREWRMERGLEGRMSWMEGGCWELDDVLCEVRGWKRWVLRREGNDENWANLVVDSPK